MHVYTVIKVYPCVSILKASHNMSTVVIYTNAKIDVITHFYHKNKRPIGRVEMIIGFVNS